jgi:hypothetical protein
MKNQDTSCAPEKSRYGGKFPLNHIEILKKNLIALLLNHLQRGRGAKVQNWPHIILKNNARHRIKTIY